MYRNGETTKMSNENKNKGIIIKQSTLIAIAIIGGSILTGTIVIPYVVGNYTEKKASPGYQFELDYPYYAVDTFHMDKTYTLTDSNISVIFYEKDVTGKYIELSSQEDSGCKMDDSQDCKKFGTIWFVPDGQTTVYATIGYAGDGQYIFDLTKMNESRVDFASPIFFVNEVDYGQLIDWVMPFNMTELKTLDQKYPLSPPHLTIPMFVQNPDYVKCTIVDNNPRSNIYAKNCSYDDIQNWLIKNTTIHMREFETKFFDSLAIGNENVGIAGDSLFGAGPFGFFTVKFENGTDVLFGNYNNTDIYPFYTQEMAIICHHKCQNGDLP